MSAVEVQDDPGVRHFGRHFVSLHCIVRNVRKPAADGYVDMSGFVVSVEGHWLWLTAGHNVDELALLLNEGASVTCRFNDAWGPQSSHHELVPIDWTAIANGRVGGFDDVDCAAFLLSEHFVSLMKVNGVQALDESGWESAPSIDKFHNFLLLGLPAEMSSHRRTRDGQLRGSNALALVHVSPARPRLMKPRGKRFPRICGRAHVVKPYPRASIKGMSGGPLFGVVPTEHGRRYWLIGIQSGWRCDLKRIYACPIQPILFGLGDLLRASRN